MAEKLLDAVWRRLRNFYADPSWCWTDEVLLSTEEARELQKWDLGQFVARVLPELTDLVQRDIERWGWRNPGFAGTSEEVLAQVRRGAALARSDDRLSSLSRVGVKLMRTHFTAYWKTQGGALETCQDWEKLKQVIAYRIGLNKYDEVWDFTREALFRGLISGRKVPSLFKPVPAAAIYREWIGDNPRPVVWDPSGGFGGRMLGFYAVYPEGRYIANEPARLTAAELRTLLPGRGEIIENGSEVEGPTCPVDMVFTSPPYFDKERYFDEPGQCWRGYPVEAEWVERYLQPTIQRGFDVLKPGGHFVLNVDDARREAVLRCARQAGLEYVRETALHVGVDHFGRKNGQGPRTEPVLVFKKNMGVITVSVSGTSGRYTVSNTGEVKSYTRSWRGTTLDGTVMATGYRTVGITRRAGEKSSTQLVHRLVCQAFHGDPPSPEHTDVRHLNGDKRDNRAENLAWGTRSENMLDVVKHRQESVRELGPAPEPKWSWYGGRTSDEALAKTCSDLYDEGELSLRAMAKILDCSADVALGIAHGRTRKGVTGKLDGTKAQKPKRSRTRKEEIRHLIREGKVRDEVNAALGETLSHQEFYYYKTTL